MFSDVAGDLPGIPGATITFNPDVSESFTPADLNSCKDTSIVISIPVMPAVTTATMFAGNLHIGPVTGGQRDPRNLSVGIGPTQNIHIRLHPASTNTAPTCYFTAEDGTWLLKADSTPANASGETDGLFTYNVQNGGPNDGKIKSTQPGQFSYDFVWTNTTGTDQTVAFTVSSASGVTAAPGNPIQYAVVSSLTGVVTASSFDAPSTSPLPPSILVPNTDALIVTYHLSYSGIGSFPIDAPTSMLVTGTLTPGGNCTAGALRSPPN
jgi:hypothetical protein